MSSDDFQLKIFQEINKSNTGKNIMVSPLSIYHILSLTANGAENKTLDEMLKVLCEKGKKELNVSNKSIYSIIEKYVTTEIANAVFTRFTPLEGFMKIVKEYKAKVEPLKDAAQVNKWCSEATHTKIPQILDSLTDNDLMVLINAIYFKGEWEKAFNKNETFKEPFMNFNKDAKDTDFMHLTQNFDYFENDNLQAISLNYLKDNLKALIILPKKEADINSYIKGLSLDIYNEITNNLINKKVILSLPKFEINFSDELKPYFIALGMIEAFGDADFSAMKKEKDIQIGKIIHKTFIKIDEQGTEAAAATAVVMRKCMMPRPQPTPVMNVNHPFLFIIRSNDLPAGHDMLFCSKIESL
jgi:serpin B